MNIIGAALIFLLSFLVALVSSYKENVIGEPGILISPSIEYSNHANSQPQPDDCTGLYGAFCKKDCETLMLCAGDKLEIYGETCGKINQTRPFCVDSACTGTLPDKDKQCPSNINKLYQCTSNGIFPDPNDCTKYFVCIAGKASAEVYQCDSAKKLIYSSERKICLPAGKTTTSQARCYTVNCGNGHANEFMSYPGNSGFYAFCSPTGPIMFKCLDDENQVFDKITNKCAFNCKSTGFFIDRTSCTDYYLCERVAGKLEAIKQSCPPGFKFDGKSCVYAPNCKPEISPQ